MQKLTIQEEEAMQVIWKKRGYVKGVKMGNSFRYEPVISPEVYQKNHFLSTNRYTCANGIR